MYVCMYEDFCRRTTRFCLAALLLNVINIFFFIDKSTLSNYHYDDKLC